MDRRARPFQRAGIPIGCAEFVSMAMTPPLDTASWAPPPSPAGPPPDPGSIERVLIDRYGAEGFAGVARAADDQLLRLEEEPHHHCMMRHLLESIRRLALLAPRHAAAAAGRDLPSTVPLSELLLRLHLLALEGAAELDRDALPLQRAGVPILCRDVPPIPTAP